MPTLSAKRPMTIIVCIILIATLGIISFTKMESTLLPEFELPYVVVYTSYPGASPEKVELAVTQPLESALSTTGGLEDISSVSADSLSLVILQFAYSTNMDSALIEMNSNIDLIKGYLDDSVSAPMLMQIDPDMLPVIVAAASVEGMGAAAASEYINENVIPEIERVDGVADVSATGLVQDSVRITFDEAALGALQAKLTAEVVDGFADARQELADSRAELEDGKKELTDGREELDSARTKAERELRARQRELDSARAQLDAGKARLGEAIAYIDAGAAPEAGRAELEAQLAALEAQEQQLDEGQKALDNARRSASSQMNDAEEQLNDADTQLSDAEEQLNDAEEQLNSAMDEALRGANVRNMITSEMLSGIIMAGNFSMPAGYVVEEGERLSVRVGNNFSSMEELEDLLLFDMEATGEVRVRDIATLELTDDSGSNYAKINGNDGVLLMVNKQSSASTTSVASDIRAAFERLEGNGDGVEVTVLSDQGVYIEIVVNTVIQNLLVGAVLAIIVLMIFLRSAKPTLVVALSIPVSLLLAVTLMYFFDISLNLISLCGLAMGVGMLVDNSIVVMENIYRLRAEGMSAVKAAIMGAKEVGGAITASTLTTICVFLPILFTDGLSRELFMDMGLTIAFSLIASLVAAMSVVPALSSMMLTKGAKPEPKLFTKLMDIYERSLRFVLKHKAPVIILVVALLGASVYGAFSAGTAFLPASDSLQLIVSASVDEELSGAEAREIMDEAGERLRSIDGVDSVGVMEGGATGLMGMGGGGSEGGGSYTIYTLLSEDRTATSAEITKAMRDATADLNASFSFMSGSMDMTSLMQSGVSIDIYGRDLDELRNIARGIAELARAVPGVASVSDGIGETSVELNIVVDKEAAMRYGLTTAQVYSAVSTALSTESAASSVELATGEADILVIKSDEATITSETLPELLLDGTLDGEERSIALSEIASIERGESQQSINRSNNSRRLSVSATIEPDYNIGNVSREMESAIAGYALPDGYKLEFSGENETINDTLGDLIDMCLLALLLIYLIMVAQFQSLLSPFIVMLTIPLAFTGGLLLQWACGFEVSVISMLGLLVLFGVIVNNGIVFVDCANGIYSGGLEKRDALVVAGRRRMRPILMTTLTTVLALVTMCFGVGTGADMIQPMAIVLVGGLVYGTLMTLYVVPMFYDLFRRKAPKIVDTEE